MPSSNTVMAVFTFDDETTDRFKKVVQPLVETHTGLKYVDARSFYEPLTVKMSFISELIEESRLVIVDAAMRSLQVAFFKASHLHQVSEQSDLQRLVPVGGNRNANHVLRLSVDVVAAVNAEERPAVPFEDAGELLARNRLHMAISSTLSLLVDLGWSISTERHPSMAS